MSFFESIDILYILVGVVAGVSSGMFGIGGGMVIVPFMLSLGLSSHHAIAISVFQMIFSSIFGSYLNYKKNNLNLKDGVFVGLGGLIGASFSGLVVRAFSDAALTAAFLILSIIFFTKYAFGVKNYVSATGEHGLKKRLILLGAGVLTGVFAVSLGIGGGLLIAPILGYALGYDSKKVVPLSLFFVIFASLAGTASFMSLGVINEELAARGVMVGIASMIGVFIGIKIIEKMQIKAHRKVLLCVYALSITLTFVSLLRKLGIL